MPKEIYLVKVGMTMTEGMVAEWYVNDGESVTEGEMLYVLETEKITMDVDAEGSGIVRHRVDVGEMLEPGDVVGFIFAPDEPMPKDVRSMVAEKAELEPIEEPGEPRTAVPAPRPVETARVRSSPAARKLAEELGVSLADVAGSGPGGRVVKEDVEGAFASSGPAPAESRVKASPIARRLAGERGVDLTTVSGTGPGGRIVEADILGVAEAPVPKASVRSGTSLPLSSMRRTIGRRMFESLQSMAQLTMDMEVPMDDAVKLRAQLIDEWGADDVRPTYTDLVIRAVSKALSHHPLLNSMLADNEILVPGDIHIGIAVSLDEGLVVPVLRHADRLSVREVAEQSARLAEAARAGRLGMDDYAGGTFTISSLGMYGVDSFTPIINAPQSAILGVNRIFEGVAWEDDRPVKAMRMNLSLTWDHRVADGAPAAQFLADVRDLLAAPYRLLI